MKTLANEIGEELDIRPPIGTGSLLLFPIFTTGALAPDYLCGAAIDGPELVAFHELNDGAEVPQLVVENGNDLPLLLIEGEMLLGLKQNRTLNTSVICAPRAATTIPVSCLEAGRWGESRPVTRSTRHAPPRLRAHKTRSVTQSIREGLGRESDQMGVWDQVAAYEATIGVSSPTSALEDVNAAMQDDVEHLVAGLSPLDGQRGVVVATGGRLSVDLFDKPSTLNEYWDALVAGYAVDAVGSGPADVTVDQARAFVDRVLRAEATPAEAAGDGMELHVDSDGVVGCALQWNNVVVHLAAFEVAA